MTRPSHRCRRRIVTPLLVACAAASALGGSTALAHEKHEECATTPTPAEAAVLQAQRDAGAYLPPPAGDEGAHVVPLTFHVVRTDEGEGGLPQERLDQALLDTNIAFAGSGITFCIQGPIDYIDSDAFYYDIDTIEEINELRTTNPVPNTVNCYFTENLATENFGLCGISAFTSSEIQAIAMRNSCTATDSNHSTFPHEIGHYFDLFHTHETSFGEECVSGVNCAEAGDLLCDTPADPRLSGLVTAECVYIGDALDPCDAVPYAPPVENLMSYSQKHCRIEFTDEQNTKAFATLVNLRPELDNETCPNSADVNGDGVTDVEDIVAVILAWGPCAEPCPEDVDGNGTVDVADLVAVILGWGS